MILFDLPDLPLIDLEGTPYEQGHIHGSVAWKRIEDNIGLYFKRFEDEAGLPSGQVLDRAKAYWPTLKYQCWDYADSLRGMAAGSGIDLMSLVALNIRYEIMYHEYTAHSMSDGCSAIAIAPDRTANGHLLMAENWDWFPGVKGLILRTRGEGLRTISFSEAGIVGGKIGLNSHNLGLTINGLNSTSDDWSRLRKPFHVRCFEILRSQSLERAIDIATAGTRSCSANFLIAQIEDKIANVETSPLTTKAIRAQSGMMMHTNHFLEPNELDVVEPDEELVQYSTSRLCRMQELSENIEGASIEDLRTMMSDHDGHPYGICRHIDGELPPEEQYMTVMSVIMDLHECMISITCGPPCEGTHVEYSLNPAITFI